MISASIPHVSEAWTQWPVCFCVLKSAQSPASECGLWAESSLHSVGHQQAQQLVAVSRNTHCVCVCDWNGKLIKVDGRMNKQPD